MALRLTASQHRERARSLLERAKSAPEPDRESMHDLAERHMVQARFVELREWLLAGCPTLH
jgi:hypothetical protein